MAARKRLFQDNLSPCSDESREDFTKEQAAGALDDFAAIVYIWWKSESSVNLTG